MKSLLHRRITHLPDLYSLPHERINSITGHRSTRVDKLGGSLLLLSLEAEKIAKRLLLWRLLQIQSTSSILFRSIFCPSGCCIMFLLCRSIRSSLNLRSCFSRSFSSVFITVWILPCRQMYSKALSSSVDVIIFWNMRCQCPQCFWLLGVIPDMRMKLMYWNTRYWGP